MFFRAVANSISIRAVDETGLQRSQVNVARFDLIRPAFAGVFRVFLESCGESTGPVAHEPRVMHVQRQVLVAIALADRGNVFVKDGARSREVRFVVSEDRRTDDQSDGEDPAELSHGSVLDNRRLLMEITWLENVDEALARAKKLNNALLLDF